MSTSSEPLRTFVAFELPPTVLEAVGQAQARLAARLPGRVVRWTRVEGIHLTLKFLGDTPSELVPEVERRLQGALASISPFALELAPLGVFPSAGWTRVVWIGLAGDVLALDGVQRKVEEVISPLGYPAEKRPFSPHLTLGRVADFASQTDRREIGAAVASAPPPPRHRFEVGELSLMRSQLGPGGAQYSRLFAVPLGQ